VCVCSFWLTDSRNAIFGRAPPNVLAAMAVSERQEIERKMVPSRRREVYGLQEDPPEQNDFGRRCLSPFSRKAGGAKAGR